jgi:hypothetical protein
LITSTATVVTPVATAGIVACNSVDDTNVVTTVVPVACNCAPVTNPVPITSSSPVVAPAFSVTVALVTVGSGFHTGSLVDALVVGNATVTAVIVTIPAAGIEVGGVYRPLVEIVPTVLDPPAIAFTCQVTAMFELNCAVDPSRTSAGPLTITCGVLDPLLTLEEHPPNPSAPLRTASPKPQPSKPKRRHEDSKSIRRIMRPLHQVLS